MPNMKIDRTAWKEYENISDVITCQELCLHNQLCVALHYNGEDLSCHLFNYTRLNAGLDYVSDDNYDYYEYFITPIGKDCHVLGPIALV